MRYIVIYKIVNDRFVEVFNSKGEAENFLKAIGPVQFELYESFLLDEWKY